MQKYRITRLHHSIDGVDYISKYVKGLKKVGTSFKACCPFHHEKTPSFTIYPKGYRTKFGIQDYESFYCFGCDAGGDIIRFYELLNKVSREEAIIQLEHEYGFTSNADEELIFLQEEMKRIKKRSVKLLTFAEVNLIISITCRKYLEFVKKYYIQEYMKEKRNIDGYYRYIDYMLPDCNDLEANILYDKIKKKLALKKQNLKIKYMKG